MRSVIARAIRWFVCEERIDEFDTCRQVGINCSATCTNHVTSPHWSPPHPVQIPAFHSHRAPTLIASASSKGHRVLTSHLVCIILLVVVLLHVFVGSAEVVRGRVFGVHVKGENKQIVTKGCFF